eukprot:222893_1
MSSTNSIDNHKKWILLKRFPKQYRSNFVMLNGSEFCSAPSNTKSGQKGFGIYKYNHQLNKWISFFKYPNQFELPVKISLSINHNTNQLYLFDGSESLTIINIKTKTFETETNFEHIGLHSQSLIINNTYHLIGGKHKTFHYIQKLNCKPFKLDVFDGCNEGFGLIYVKSQQLLLLFGGYDNNNWTYLDTIWYFELGLSNNKWHKMDAKLPRKMARFGYVVTSNDKYCILFGGMGDSIYSNKYMDIFIWDLDTMEFTQSNIYCPQQSKYSAVISCKPHKLLVIGYIRTYINDILIPEDIIKLIELFFVVDDYVHLFNNKSHWKIKVKHIIEKYSDSNYYPVVIKQATHNEMYTDISNDDTVDIDDKINENVDEKSETNIGMNNEQCCTVL